MPQRWIVECKNQHCGIDLVMNGTFLRIQESNRLDKSRLESDSALSQMQTDTTYAAADLDLRTKVGAREAFREDDLFWEHRDGLRLAPFSSGALRVVTRRHLTPVTL